MSFPPIYDHFYPANASGNASDHSLQLSIQLPVQPLHQRYIFPPLHVLILRISRKGLSITVLGLTFDISCSSEGATFETKFILQSKDGCVAKVEPVRAGGVRSCASSLLIGLL